MEIPTSMRTYTRGQRIVEQGSAGGSMFMVRSGKIRIYRTHEGTETTLAFLGPGEVFGEMALFTHRPRSASAEAAEDSELRVITRAEFDAMTCDPVIRQLLENMAGRLADIDASYERLAVDATRRREFMSSLSARKDWVAL